MTDYLSCADTAKLLRRALARAFPGVKFSVRSHVYAGGASIDVKYDGLDRYDPLASCYCHGDAPDVDPRDKGRCRRCGYIGRSIPVYKPGMPSADDVKAVTDLYTGADFDGMIDMKIYRRVHLDADDNPVGSTSPGTTGSRGSIPAHDDSDTYAVAARAVRTVHPGADYIFVTPYTDWRVTL